MRIAVYCRVSTNEEMQQHSLRQQEEYYRAALSFSKEHMLVGIYVDTASGLSQKGRPGFNKMIRDCKRGKIDLIVTKSISRFSRNTVEFLKIIRDLKAHGIDVWFEISEIIRTNVDVDLGRDAIAIDNLREFTEKANSLLYSKPEIASEWNYERNGNLRPEHFLANSSKKVWWTCIKMKKKIMKHMIFAEKLPVFMVR